MDDMAASSKTDVGRDHTPSSIESTPEQEIETAQDHAPPQKRKGGRKPVSIALRVCTANATIMSNILCRYTRRRRSESNGIGRLKQRSVKGGPNTSSSSKQLLSRMKTRLQICSRAIALLLMNVSCSAIRIRY